ncbi:MAG TPA: signal peptidase II [Stellaceae bacterium]|jgi:signal peptidase II|nr:signal peptidase II [Stellaceae bacterium]
MVDVRRNVALSATVVVAVLVVDQLSKLWILARFPNLNDSARVTDFFDLVRVANRGVSFGLFNNGAAINAILFSLLAAAIVAALIVWLFRATGTLLPAAIGLVIGGAIGNVADRLRLGSVVDFLDFHLGAWHWPAFNVADAAICIGVGLMLLDGLIGGREAAN